MKEKICKPKKKISGQRSGDSDAIFSLFLNFYISKTWVSAEDNGEVMVRI